MLVSYISPQGGIATLNYRSFSDLDRCIATNLWRLPPEVDLIAGIPRSGLLAANMLALHLNKRLTTVADLIEGRVFECGRRLAIQDSSIARSAQTIAVVDDSVATGYEMRRVRGELEAAGICSNIVYVAIYADDDSSKEVDIYFEICPHPRMFAWNLMHRNELTTACVDIDGVLCADPTVEENDDGPQYRRFLSSARPLMRPTQEIGTLVTCRLERYRAETEAWLRYHAIRYRELIMWDLPNKQARVSSGGHGEFKALIYRSRRAAEVFIESSADQAQVIADLSFKPVICIESQMAHLPGMRPVLFGAARNVRTWLPKGLNRIVLRMARAHW